MPDRILTIKNINEAQHLQCCNDFNWKFENKNEKQGDNLKTANSFNYFCIFNN